MFGCAPAASASIEQAVAPLYLLNLIPGFGFSKVDIVVNPEEDARTIVDQINRDRVLSGYPPVTLDDALSAQALKRAQDVAADPESPKSYGYISPSGEFGENSIYTNQPAASVNGWETGHIPTHLDVMYHQYPQNTVGVGMVPVDDKYGDNWIVIVQFA